MQAKTRSFTLTELLVVMIITAIVVAIAFTVLRLVQKQVHIIAKNIERSSNLQLFEQRLWQDFNEHRLIKFSKENNTLICQSEADTISYVFRENYTLRNTDTVKLKLVVVKTLFRGQASTSAPVDAIHITANQELPDYAIFVSKKNDVALYMETDGI